MKVFLKIHRVDISVLSSQKSKIKFCIFNFTSPYFIFKYDSQVQSLKLATKSRVLRY